MSLLLAVFTYDTIQKENGNKPCRMEVAVMKPQKIQLNTREHMFLMCKNTPVYDITGNSVINECLLPGIMQMYPDTATFNAWMKYRYSSGTNTVARKLKGITFGQGARKRINAETHALSFCDCYWLKSGSEDICFEDISPYYTRFWDGTTDFQGQAAPTLYVSGALSKEWKRDGRLYKYGDVSIELRCIELCDFCGVLAESAELIPGGIAIENFTSANVMLEQADQSGKIDPDNFDEGDVLRLFGSDGAKMLIIDAIIGNGDRHAGNFGWLRDSSTGAYLKMAPLYDFDHALDSTLASDRLLTDAVAYCAEDYSDIVINIARAARLFEHPVFSRRAETILDLMRK